MNCNTTHYRANSSSVPGDPTAIVRALGCFLSLFVIGLGFLWVLFDDERQSWHDKIAGTVIVHAPKGTSLV